jgi:hypothetical protein
MIRSEGPATEEVWPTEVAALVRQRVEESQHLD